MQNTYVSRTTNTATMNKDSAKQKHNHRDAYTIKRELEKDPTRSFGDTSKDEVWITLLDENHKTYASIVNDLFKDAINKYNEIQIKSRHKDRCKRSYSAYWKDNKKNKCDSPVVEMIVQVGGTYDENKEYATGLVDPEIGKVILKEFVRQFQAEYPLLEVIDCTYHQGEATPHIHLDFVPIAKDEKLGLTASLDKACEQMGFGEKSSGRTTYSVRDFQYDFHKLFDCVCEHYGISIDHPMLTRDHESVTQYRKNEKLRQDQSRLEKGNNELISEQNKLEATVSTLSKDIETATTTKESLRNEISGLNKDITDLQSSKEELQQQVDKLENDVDETNAENKVFFMEVDEKRFEAKNTLKWYEQRSEQFITLLESTRQLIEFLKTSLQYVTEKIFSVKGVELQKTDFYLENGDVTSRCFQLVNTNSKKVLLRIDDCYTRNTQEVALEEDEKILYDANTTFISDLASHVKNGDVNIYVFDIDESYEHEIKQPKRHCKPEITLGPEY